MEDLLKLVLPIVIVVVIALVIIIYVYLLNKKLNSEKHDLRHSELDDRRRSVKVNKVSGYIPPKISAFYDVLRAAMPANYIIIPNTALELLFQRSNRKDLGLEGIYADFCVFTTKFAPVLIVDLKDYSNATGTSFIIPKNIKEMLQNSGIPVMEYSICDSYSIDDLRKTIAKAMNPLYNK